ncbi:MAG: C-type lectin domain-containing protein [Alphaproteobacteria bacterium]
MFLRVLRFALPAVFATLVAAPAVSAYAKELCNKPVYNPDTKSYFELACPQEGEDRRIEWHEAIKLAAKRVFKGVRGRLAVVKTQEVNDFLRDTFDPEAPPWIGLRYFCKYNKLLWVTGEVQPATAYSNWASPWNLNGWPGHGDPAMCGWLGYLPVHYWVPNYGFQWNANGQNKEFPRYFVEYPTGKE